MDEACSLLTRQLALQSQQSDVDAVVLAQGHAALGALQWERNDLEGALASFERAEVTCRLALQLPASAITIPVAERLRCDLCPRQANYDAARSELDLAAGIDAEEDLAERRVELATELASALNSMAIVLQVSTAASHVTVPCNLRHGLRCILGTAGVEHDRTGATEVAACDRALRGGDGPTPRVCRDWTPQSRPCALRARPGAR